MEFRIADSFTESLAKLSGEEQKAVKITATDLLLNPDQPGLRLHRLDKTRDKNFWSIRVNNDLRIIVHRAAQSLLLCYVAHHDQAYQWAERRKLETHPKTGAAQLVEIRELVREIPVDHHVQAPSASAEPKLFEHISESELLGYGVPREWLEEVLTVTEGSLLDVASHLPGEAAEALLNVALGLPATPSPMTEPRALPPGETASRGISDPFTHPDAQRRFWPIKTQEDLRQALDYPWEKWAIFLHPAQRQLVERRFNGAARASGSAGTGKTIVALHRAVYLARSNSNARVLLTTFSEILASALRQKVQILLATEPRLGEQIEVEAIDAIGARLYGRVFGSPRVADDATIRRMLAEAAAASTRNKFSERFLNAEWDQVVDAWQLKVWEEYRDVNRLGRRTRLPESAREVLWSIFSQVIARLESEKLVTPATMFTRLAAHFRDGAAPPFDFAVVDEAQDVSIPQLRFLAAIGAGRPNALFFSGDLGQRIFQQPFSWKSLGVDVRGRSSTLRINYRTSHQIRLHADRLLGPEVSDVDGNTEGRKTISIFDGVAPEIAVCKSESDEASRVAEWLASLLSGGAAASEVAIFIRSEAQLARAQAAAEAAGLPFKILDQDVSPASGHVSIGTMHLAKGLEFRAVAVMACDDEVIPLQERIEAVTDPADLEEVYNTERHLLYVACTRARDRLLITSTAPASEFLDDLRG